MNLFWYANYIFGLKKSLNVVFDIYNIFFCHWHKFFFLSSKLILDPLLIALSLSAL